MKIEKPCTPGHCLKMLNDNMRTDILRSVHQHMRAKMDQGKKKSPLKMLIESIEQVLEVYEGSNLFEIVQRNPFNVESRTKFNPETDYKHDIKLLKSQLKALREILTSLGKLF